MRDALVLGGILAVAAALRCLEIDRPFVGHHDFHAAFYALAGDGRRLGAYPNWPPLTDALYALSLLLFGRSEWAVRVLPIGFSLGTVALVAAIGRDLFGRATGWLAAALLAILPGAIYFARIESFGFFVALTLWSYGRWLDTRRTGHLALAVCSNLIGFGFSYAAVWIAGPPNLLRAIARRDLRGQALLALTTVLALLAWLAWLALRGELSLWFGVAGSDSAKLLAQPAWRELWLQHARDHAWLLFTPLPLLAAVGWLASLTARRSAGDAVLLLWLLAVLLWLLASPQHSIEHDMWWLPLGAPLALITARTLTALERWPRWELGVTVGVFAATLAFSARQLPLLLAVREPGPPPLEFGRAIRAYLDAGDTMVGWKPNEVWYAGVRGTIWPLIRSQAAYADWLASQRPALVVVGASDPAWRFELTRAASYTPVSILGWVTYLRDDVAVRAAARDPEIAAALQVARSLHEGELIRAAGDPTLYRFGWGLRLPVAGAPAGVAVRSLAPVELARIPAGPGFEP